jgi:2-polyprenyl-6-hydroxyphenyl methylase/3-demethylubiquinone-9 3-methyltransferase
MENIEKNNTHEWEVKDGARFAFGVNWSHFLTQLNEQRVQDAIDSLKMMLKADTLDGKTFLDIGSGSGLFSLAARRMGAKVVSFDYDPQSVACTRKLKSLYYSGDSDWQIQQGSVLDANYTLALGKFDVVYSWGVLHHTGSMWNALDNVDALVAPKGQLFIALYNYQPIASRYWAFVKRTYNKRIFTRPFLIAIHLIYPTLPGILIRFFQCKRPRRGMSAWYDLIDWLGGYPFEVAKPEHIFNFFSNRGYQLQELKTVGGRLGCNEFVFYRPN